MPVPEIFDRAARRFRRDRAGISGGIIDTSIAEELLDRLDSVARRFSTPLVIGASTPLLEGLTERGLNPRIVDPGPLRASTVCGLTAEEDALPFAPLSFDLVLAAGTLDTVADLPGALILIRRALRPDGLFLGCMTGSPSLPQLRAALAVADSATRRVHPQIDTRAAGDLLTRAGFALPVADATSLYLTYCDLDRLIADLRASAATNVLAERAPLSRTAFAVARAAFAGLGKDGRVTETVTLITMTGWAPDPSQPRPARRGSASASLAEALRNPSL